MVVHDSSTAKFPFSSSELYPDFDWETVERPVRVGDTFLLLLLGIETGPIRWHYRNFYGLILREITNDVFERMGKVMLFCDIRDYEEGPDLNDRLHDDLTESLPIRKVKII
ncbi:hypothetical protein PTNB73_00287 [Pyrenophora teres f. teres]|nr:hypothetical protein HRS9139_01531 [Pyrenophora teres f. teres]KAE8851271.1 hypothetical protein HRS9122_01558 [Pyrenophora teres f. teres]KAE8869944.1 hypothetical protein PTNB29_00288 [Pyrenophora teres f. teres]KAE8873655.1 hypothetical protein PTNB73_00287 [Pyrenophora teres f. teres]